MFNLIFTQWQKSEACNLGLCIDLGCIDESLWNIPVYCESGFCCGWVSKLSRIFFFLSKNPQNGPGPFIGNSTTVTHLPNWIYLYYHWYKGSIAKSSRLWFPLTVTFCNKRKRFSLGFKFLQFELSFNPVALEFCRPSKFWCCPKNP